MLIRKCSKCNKFLGLKLYVKEGLGGLIRNILDWKITAGLCEKCLKKYKRIKIR